MEPIQNGKYYHIYNRGNNREDLFRTPENYLHFFRLYEKYIFPIAETFAWVLMKNHFHLLVRVKNIDEIGVYKSLNSDGSGDCVRFQTTTNPNLSNPNLAESRVNIQYPNPAKHFSHLFNAYSKYINQMFNRTGSLFERPFHRIPIDSDKYFRQLIVYIHNNPVHHGFTDDYKDYPWSSYGTVLSLKPTKLSRDKVIGWFDDKTNFVEVHNKKVDMEFIKNLIIE